MKKNEASNVPAGEKQIVKTQGLRRMPKPSDKLGCTHMGVLELKELPRGYLKTYLKTGGWLYGRGCFGCKEKHELGGGDEREVLDLSTLLTCKKVSSSEVARYCNFGVTSHSMDTEDDWKIPFACDMVLCMPCYKECLVKQGDLPGGNRRSRRV